MSEHRFEMTKVIDPMQGLETFIELVSKYYCQVIFKTLYTHPALRQVGSRRCQPVEGAVHGQTAALIC